MNNTSRQLLGVACALALATPLMAQQDLGRDGTAWRWDGALPSGGTVRLFNINGALHFTASSDGSLHLQAEKQVQSGGDPRSLHYAVFREGDNLTICALVDDATCDASGIHSDGRERGNRDRRRNVTAEISVQVPKGVNSSGNTINGDVTVERVDADVRANTVNGTIRVTRAGGQVSARTVNGDVNVDTRGGPVSAETVNGSIKAAMGATGTADMRFRTVSGDIDISAPSPLNARVELNTLNGSIDSKFPLYFERDRHRASGTVGSGGRLLIAHTVNGSITIN
jgi:hypothetical protein